MHKGTHSHSKVANKDCSSQMKLAWLVVVCAACKAPLQHIQHLYRWPQHHVCPAMAISNIVVPGVAISSVDMIPIRAYAKAQKGKASGSLHGNK